MLHMYTMIILLFNYLIICNIIQAKCNYKRTYKYDSSCCGDDS